MTTGLVSNQIDQSEALSSVQVGSDIVGNVTVDVIEVPEPESVQILSITGAVIVLMVVKKVVHQLSSSISSNLTSKASTASVTSVV